MSKNTPRISAPVPRVITNGTTAGPSPAEDLDERVMREMRGDFGVIRLEHALVFLSPAVLRALPLPSLHSRAGLRLGENRWWRRCSKIRRGGRCVRKLGSFCRALWSWSAFAKRFRSCGFVFPSLTLRRGCSQSLSKARFFNIFPNDASIDDVSRDEPGRPRNCGLFKDPSKAASFSGLVFLTPSVQAVTTVFCTCFVSNTETCPTCRKE